MKAVFLWLALSFAASAAEPDLVLTGTLDGRDNHTYREVPFTVPAGTQRISVAFDYTGRDEKTTVDLGLLDAEPAAGFGNFRGWSGGNKRSFTVSTSDATPSFRAGPIRAGRWSLLLGIPNIRKESHSVFTAKVWFDRTGAAAALPDAQRPVLKDAPGWYRGDLHLHTAHSDGSCASRAGRKVPCPLALTASLAAERALDFVAVSDHNTTSHFAALRELQPYYDRTLLMPAREITTFQGHANVFGTTAPIDFRVGTKAVPDWNALLRDIAGKHGLVSINHPVRPSGEICMGCGWTPEPAADFARVQAVEVVNGADADTPLSGVPFWEGLLSRGLRITAVGGSDNHEATAPQSRPGSSTIGTPATVIYAQALSETALLDGIRAGRVFVDVTGSRDRWLEFTAKSGAATAMMGDTLKAAAGAPTTFTIRVRGAAGARVELIEDGHAATVSADLAVKTGDATLTVEWPSDGKRHWRRANVRAADGKLLLIGNAVYLE